MAKVLKLEPKGTAASSSCRAHRRGPREDSPLTPQLQEFIDRVVVPILIKEYLAETDAENRLAKRDFDAAHSDSTTAAQELRTVRP